MIILDIFAGAVLVLLGVHVGYKLARGEEPITIPRKMKRVIRTEEEENKLLSK